MQKSKTTNSNNNWLLSNVALLGFETLKNYPEQIYFLDSNIEVV